jgi:hypothetical protein
MQVSCLDALNYLETPILVLLLNESSTNLKSVTILASFQKIELNYSGNWF